MTYDEIRYQIWVVNHPFDFAWNWLPPGEGSHVQVVTGYATDSQGNEWVYVNNPEPQGQGDFECMSYNEWVADPSSNSPYWPHTHIGDWYDFTYNNSRLIYNLATNSTQPTNAITEGQAPNLAGVIISDRSVPFQFAGQGFSVSGTIRQRIVQETASQTLDFYYQISNSSGSTGDVNEITVGNFGSIAVAAGYRPDGTGTIHSTNASRDISGQSISIYMDAVAPGNSSNFLLLMTNATAANNNGTMMIGGLNPQIPTSRGRAQISTDQPLSVPLSASIGACPVMQQTEANPQVELRATKPQIGLPIPLMDSIITKVRKAALAALPQKFKNLTIGQPYQIAFVGLGQLKAYAKSLLAKSIIQPSGGFIVPILSADTVITAVFLKRTGSSLIPVALGERNMMSLVTKTMQVVQKLHNVDQGSLSILKIPALFLTFVARSEGEQIWLTPVMTYPGFDLQNNQEGKAEDVFSRLVVSAKNSHPSGHSTPTKVSR